MNTFSDYLDPDSDLAHYGVKGMKWGVRKSKKSYKLKTASKKISAFKQKSRDKREEKAEQKSLKKARKNNDRADFSTSVHLSSMSDTDLQNLLKRMDMERRYIELTTAPKETSRGKQVTKDILYGAAKNVGTSYLTSVGNRGLKKLDKNYSFKTKK